MPQGNLRWREIPNGRWDSEGWGCIQHNTLVAGEPSSNTTPRAPPPRLQVAVWHSTCLYLRPSERQPACPSLPRSLNPSFSSSLPLLVPAQSRHTPHPHHLPTCPQAPRACVGRACDSAVRQHLARDHRASESIAAHAATDHCRAAGDGRGGTCDRRWAFVTVYE